MLYTCSLSCSYSFGLVSTRFIFFLKNFAPTKDPAYAKITKGAATYNSRGSSTFANLARIATIIENHTHMLIKNPANQMLLG